MSCCTTSASATGAIASAASRRRAASRSVFSRRRAVDARCPRRPSSADAPLRRLLQWQVNVLLAQMFVLLLFYGTSNQGSSAVALLVVTIDTAVVLVSSLLSLKSFKWAELTKSSMDVDEDLEELRAMWKKPPTPPDSDSEDEGLYFPGGLNGRRPSRPRFLTPEMGRVSLESGERPLPKLSLTLVLILDGHLEHVAHV